MESKSRAGLGVTPQNRSKKAATMEIKGDLVTLVVTDDIRKKYRTREEVDQAIAAALQKTVESLQRETRKLKELQELEKAMDEQEEQGGLIWPFDTNISF
jgi:hypothetical protein